MKSFKVDWVIKNKLAIGIAPREKEHLNILKNQGIKSIMSLCDVSEAPPPKEMNEIFNCERIVLPDHKYDRNLEIEEISNVLKTMKKMEDKMPIYVHCLAGKERSPLICMAWLRVNKKIDNIQALNYMMQVHSGTCPLDDHLYTLDNYLKTL